MGVREFVEESDEVAVVLISFEVARVSPYLQNHVLQAGAVSEHPVRTLRRNTRMVIIILSCFINFIILDVVINSYLKSQ